MTAGAARAATMAGCPCPTPTTSWPTSIPPSARPSTITLGTAVHPGRRRQRQDPGHLAAGGVRARDGVVRPRDVLVVTFTDKAASEMAGRLAALGPAGRRGVHVPCRRAPPAPPFLAARPRDGSAGDPRIQGADPRPAGEGPAGRLSLPRRARPRGGDRMGQGPPDRAGRVRDPGDRRGPRRVAPAGPDGRPVPTLRDGQGPSRPDRLRGHARADDRAHRGRRGDRGRGPRPLSLVLGRRVPGHQPAPGGAPRGVAGRARRPGGRR